jgi:hypothetical protein
MFCNEPSSPAPAVHAAERRCSRRRIKHSSEGAKVTQRGKQCCDYDNDQGGEYVLIRFVHNSDKREGLSRTKGADSAFMKLRRQG